MKLCLNLNHRRGSLETVERIPRYHNMYMEVENDEKSLQKILLSTYNRENRESAYVNRGGQLIKSNLKIFF